MKRQLPVGTGRHKLNLVLTQSELDYIESLFPENSSNELMSYVRHQIREAREQMKATQEMKDEKARVDFELEAQAERALEECWSNQ